MSNSPPTLAHVSIGTNRLDHALRFYDKVLGTLGIKRILDIPNLAVGYGYHTPDFWVQLPHDRQAAATANGSHFAFTAISAEQVHAFHAAALESGGSSDGEPGPRPHYGAAYYACFIRDPDGHKIEAMFWDTTKAG